MVKYSFIVPVYNVEKYIGECVESLLRQGEICEVILVDDGSTDLSGSICDSYAEKFDNVKVFHGENAGPAAARNFGLLNAVGEYVVFIDSDDFISDGFVENLENENCCADLIFYDIVKRFANGREEPMAEGLKKDRIHNKPMEEVLDFISRCNKFPASSGGKIIKREMLAKHKILFVDNILGEDIDWTLRLVSNSESADFFEGGVYYYRISCGTRHSYGNIKNLSDQLGIIEEWSEKYADNSKHVLEFLAYQYSVLLPYYGAVSKKERILCKERMKKQKYLLSYGKTKKIFLIKTAVAILGIHGTSKLLYKYVTKRDRVNA